MKDTKQKCRSRICQNYFTSTSLGRRKASDDGWLVLKNGKAFCERHIPDWFIMAHVIIGGGETNDASTW